MLDKLKQRQELSKERVEETPKGDYLVYRKPIKKQLTETEEFFNWLVDTEDTLFLKKKLSQFIKENPNATSKKINEFEAELKVHYNHYKKSGQRRSKIIEAKSHFENSFIKNPSNSFYSKNKSNFGKSKISLSSDYITLFKEYFYKYSFNPEEPVLTLCNETNIKYLISTIQGRAGNIKTFKEQLDITISFLKKMNELKTSEFNRWFLEYIDFFITDLRLNPKEYKYATDKLANILLEAINKDNKRIALESKLKNPSEIYDSSSEDSFIKHNQYFIINALQEALQSIKSRKRVDKSSIGYKKKLLFLSLFMAEKMFPYERTKETLNVEENKLISDKVKSVNKNTIYQITKLIVYHKPILEQIDLIMDGAKSIPVTKPHILAAYLRTVDPLLESAKNQRLKYFKEYIDFSVKYLLIADKYIDDKSEINIFTNQLNKYLLENQADLYPRVLELFMGKFVAIKRNFPNVGNEKIIDSIMDCGNSRRKVPAINTKYTLKMLPCFTDVQLSKMLSTKERFRYSDFKICVIDSDFFYNSSTNYLKEWINYIFPHIPEIMERLALGSIANKRREKRIIERSQIKELSSEETFAIYYEIRLEESEIIDLILEASNNHYLKDNTLAGLKDKLVPHINEMIKDYRNAREKWGPDWHSHYRALVPTSKIK
ncbi:MAG: hypothetical protein WCX82_00495 [archaeon]